MTTEKSTTDSEASVKKPEDKTAIEVHTDYPLSEKDEVKKAEENLQQAQKKSDK
ncbi:hypothetical protein [Mucilaginibacter antarcticus]|uniref:Uncharacterized protein n=1 Tax=Mucilaginibacter antarcticus TaxID=1855725 RepID=A0ABW5XML1_9SPHI